MNRTKPAERLTTDRGTRRGGKEGTVKRAKKDPGAWRNTGVGTAAYHAARTDAQTKANATGFDHGIEANDLFRSFSVRMLPRRENRYGHELRVEVVSCEDLAKCQTGHGPA